MKKIIIYLSLIITLLINIVPVYATTYSLISFKIKVSYRNVDTDYNNFDYMVVDADGNYCTISSVNNDSITYTNMTIINVTKGATHYLKVYYNDNLYETIEFVATGADLSFTLSVKEDTGDSESTESSEGSESSENSSSSTESTEEDFDLSVSNEYLDLIHNDLLILIVIISFFEFMKMINIIVRNISGGEK